MVTTVSSLFSPENKPGRLITAIRDSPTSELGPSWYDTAQVVRAWLRRPDLLPDALGQAGLTTLLNGQHRDGSWGHPPAPPAYRVVPTLAVVAALLAVNGRNACPDTVMRAAGAAAAGWRFLSDDVTRLDPGALPDTIAVELIVPTLLDTIDRSLPPGHASSSGVRAALDRHGAGLRDLRRLRVAAAAGVAPPPPVHYSLEVLDRPPAGYRHADYLIGNCLACSPSATAAALSWTTEHCRPAREYLVAEGNRLGGAWPTVAPVTVFEAAWLIGAAFRLGRRLSANAVGRLAPWLAGQLGPAGCGAGPALAPDSDDTAIVLFALHAMGRPASPRPLLRYQRDTGFATFPHERTSSVSTNAHVLEVLLAARRSGDPDARIGPAIDTAVDHLLVSQHHDGHWSDKWHASPYYATACAALALGTVPSPVAATAVRRAVDWVLDTQRLDGSWGCWTGTREETAHALNVLLASPTTNRPALAAGAGFLDDCLAGSHAPLWHAKELYEPSRIVNILVHLTRKAIIP